MEELKMNENHRFKVYQNNFSTNSRTRLYLHLLRTGEGIYVDEWA